MDLAQIVGALDKSQKRNVIALICLHAVASNYPLDVPRCIETAFKLADGFVKKMEEVPAPAEEPAQS